MHYKPNSPTHITFPFHEFVSCFGSGDDIPHDEHEVVMDHIKLSKAANRLRDAEQLAALGEDISFNANDYLTKPDSVSKAYPAFEERIHDEDIVPVSDDTPPEDFLRKQFFGCCDTFESMHKQVVSGLGR